MPWYKDKTVWGHFAVAFGLVLAVTTPLAWLGAPVALVGAWAAGFAKGMYYGREVDQEQQKLVFDRVQKDPEVGMADVGFKRLAPWKWSYGQRADLLAAIIGASLALAIILL